MEAGIERYTSSVTLSYSQLQLYRRCPKQYEFAVIKKIGRPINAGESFGASVHNTLKKWGELEIERQQSVASSQLLLFAEEKPDQSPLTTDHLLTLWHQSFIVEGYATRAEADAARQRGEKVLRAFYEWWQAEPRRVLIIEKGFEVAVDDGTITGRLDRIEQHPDGLHVIDFKTGAPRTQDEVDADLQLSIYAMGAVQLLAVPCAKLTLLFLGEEGVTAMTTMRSEGQLKDAKIQIRALIDRLESGDYHPTPSREKCRSCPYRSVCSASAV
jgi:RecB family exonuclease